MQTNLFMQHVDPSANLAFATGTAKRVPHYHHQHYGRHPAVPGYVALEQGSGVPGAQTFNRPFSHIQVLKRPPNEEATGKGKIEPSLPVFKKLSHVEEAERDMASYNKDISAAGDSIANMPVGTTFAAVTRAAELNAARAAKAAKALADKEELEAEYPPALAPVSLGALKFTKRTRGRGGWKSSTLNEYLEEEAPSHIIHQASSQNILQTDDQEASFDQRLYPNLLSRQPLSRQESVGSGEGSRHHRADYINSVTSSETSDSGFLQPSPLSARTVGNPQFNQPPHLTFAQTLDNHRHEWDQNLPPAIMSGNNHPRALTARMPSQQVPQPGAMYGHTAGSYNSAPVMGQSPYVYDPSTCILNADTLSSHSNVNSYHPRNQQPRVPIVDIIDYRNQPQAIQPATRQPPLGSPQDSKRVNHEALTSTNLSSVSPSSHHKLVHDDPFKDPAPVAAAGVHDFGSHGQSNFNPRAAVRMPPSAGKPSLDRDFRFPDMYPAQQQNPTLQQKVPHGQMGRFDPRLGNGPPTTASQVRDPMPYTGGFNVSNKKDMLLQNLNDVIQTSTAQGNPYSNRTVLNDPMSRQPTANTQSSFSGPMQMPQPSVLGQQHTNQPSRTTKPTQPSMLFQDSEPLPVKREPEPHIKGVFATARSRVAGYNGLNPLPTLPPDVAHDIQVAYNAANGRPALTQQQQRDQSNEVALAEAEKWFFTHPINDGWVRQLLERSISRAKAPPPNPTINTSSQTPKLAPIGSGRPTATGLTAQDKDAIDLMAPPMTNLQSNMQRSYFSNYAQPQAWLIDHSADGDQSFYGGDWGAPPARVGRDSRYARTSHEGRNTYFEPGRGGEGGSGRR